ncbi:TPA: bacteriocin immunity protein [Salmonella enterica]|nr:bacteriocin immunity protein [Salmonella enterica subsp. enterica serovar Omuna]EEE2004617.1 bacteriocin immunity protein [Salmonella enterica subsp. enterica serovar Kotte]MBL1255165.1 bacteriocin immunity protein [Salmonella enterica subsp. enterica serovar Ceyco]MIG40980.1 bacteriocin immunity protein [Salmonella enterica subsp. enterica]HAV1237736.1 bacteriocin immunity protein [Salmonella enterica]
MELKNRLDDYTEDEFEEFLNEFFENLHGLKGIEYGKHISNLQKHFVNITQHPEGNGMIFNPPAGREDSPKGIIEELKRWRASQGLSCFKSK